jgi:16S rRNA (uracil1498-N3)-methyltransferase
MRLSRIFVGQALDPGAQIHLDSDTYHYLKNVLRLKSGAAIVLFNGEDHYDYEALISYEAKQVMATIQNRLAGTTESKLSTEIIQGLSRSDHMDWMIQKCTELGVNRISVFSADHTQITLKPAQLKKRMLHWRKIAIKACEQCGRQVPPLVSFEQNLSGILDKTAPRGINLVLDIEGDRLQPKLGPKTQVDQISILLGPEGGLSKIEIQSAKKAGFVATSIGSRVLRTETAATVALAIIQFTFGDI